jgi:hypothetical protein
LFAVSEPQAGVETQLDGGLWGITIDPDRVLLEWVQELGGRIPGRILASSGTFQYFAAAAPGAKELFAMVKIWELTQGRRWQRRANAYDLVVLDAPATGHGLTFLTVPEVFLQLVSEGPLARDMRNMQELLGDPGRCSTCIVTLPEEMPANEAIDLDRALRGHRFPAGPLFLNEAFASRFTEPEVSAVTRGGPLLTAAGEAADNHESRASLSRHYEGVLREAVARELVTVPFLFERTFGAQAIDKVSRAIEGVL